MMPVDCVLVRHAESEGNAAQHASQKGDSRHYTDEFRARHSSSWRLTDRGIHQAEAAGAWIRANLNGGRFDRAYVSPYIRALETAARLNLPDVRWRQNLYLRERDGGDLEPLTDTERRQQFTHTLERRQTEPFFWTPPNGESIADTCGRIDRVLETLHRECSDKSVILVLHGETMWAFRVLIERWSSQRFVERHTSKKPEDRIHNCQVIHYTRRDPDTGTLAPHYTHVRSVNPTAEPPIRNVWEPIIRETFSSDDLLAYVQQTPRMIAG